VFYAGHRSYATRLAFIATEDGPVEVGGDEQLQPLSEEEFQRLQEELRGEEVAPRSTPDGAPAYMTALPLFDDHSMTLYVKKVRKHFGGGLTASEDPDDGRKDLE
jgi:hypothetical protein